MVATCNDALEGLRDRALLYFAFASGCRCQRSRGSRPARFARAPGRRLCLPARTQQSPIGRREALYGSQRIDCVLLCGADIGRILRAFDQQFLPLGSFTKRCSFTKCCSGTRGDIQAQGGGYAGFRRCCYCSGQLDDSPRKIGISAARSQKAEPCQYMTGLILVIAGKRGGAGLLDAHYQPVANPLCQ